MKSEEYKKNLKNSLEEIIDNIDDTYYLMKRELENEIFQHKECVEKIDKETNKVFSYLSEDICIKLIKSTLPIRVRLFNKILWRGHGVYGVGKIEINFSFNTDTYNSFQYVFDIRDIKRILKIQE